MHRWTRPAALAVALAAFVAGCVGPGAEVKTRSLSAPDAPGAALLERLPPPPPLPEPPSPSDLAPLLKADQLAPEQIRPGDLLSVVVREEPELSGQRVRVSRAGTVLLPYLREVLARGRTRGELAEAVRLLLRERKLVRDPEVAVEILAEECRRCYVLGRVTQPGSFSLPIDRSMTLIQVIALAGGLATAKVDLEADASAIRIVRVMPDGQTRAFRVSFDQIVEREQLEKNLIIQPEDIIYVPPKKEMYIFGSVERPGGFPLADGSQLSVEEALALAGGFKTGAERDFITLIRRETQGAKAYHVPLVQPDPTRRTATMVTANDTLIVTDRLTKRVYILGEVSQQGSHPLDEAGMTVARVIGLAGGLKKSADGDNVLLTRVTAQGKQIYRVRVQRILEEGRFEEDPELLPGDVIYVPAGILSK